MILKNTLLSVVALGLQSLLILLGLCGCSSSSSGGGETVVPETVKAERAIMNFSLRSGETTASFTNVNQMATTSPKELRAAALAHLDSAIPSIRYASVYALTFTAEPGPSMEALKGVMVSGTSTERLLAATGLASLGDRDSIPVLIDFLDSAEPFPYWEPPIEKWQYAQRSLLTVTDQDLGLRQAHDRNSAATTKAAWRDWWVAHGPDYQLRRPDIKHTNLNI